MTDPMRPDDQPYTYGPEHYGVEHDDEPAPEERQPPASLGQAVLRTFAFARFTLLEYLRSGRIWVELLAAGVFYIVFLRGDIPAEKYFSLAGIFCLLLSLYTTSVIVGLGDRPQGYVVLARRVGRAGYLLGLYISTMVVLTLAYLLVAALTIGLSQVEGLPLLRWALGSLPLLLNVALLSALLLMLSPLVFSAGWRLLVLTLIALAFSGNWDFLGNAALETLPPTVQSVLSSLQTILGWPLVPAFSGFALALDPTYNSALTILVSQVSLLIALLGISIYSFVQREVLLSAE
jgi:hypothetical protein